MKQAFLALALVIGLLSILFLKRDPKRNHDIPDQSLSLSTFSSQQRRESNSSSRWPNTLSREALHARISEIDDTEVLIAFIISQLKDNEALMLEVLGDSDLGGFYIRTLSDALVAYYADKELFASLEQIEGALGSSGNYFLYDQIADGLLSNHSGQEDPRELLQYLSAPHRDHIYNMVAYDVGEQMILNQDDPKSVVELIEEFPDLTQKENLLSGALVEWMLQLDDPNPALEHIRDKEPSPSKDHLIYEAFNHYSYDDPSSILPWLEDIQEKEYKDNAIYNTAIDMSLNQPDQFKAWFSSLPESDLKTNIHHISSWLLDNQPTPSQ